MIPAKRFRIAVLLLLILVNIGTIGYHYIEGWGLLESVYATVITISTVGYGDYAPHTDTGKIFTIIMIIFGVGLMFYTIGLFAETIFEGQVRLILGRGKLEKLIAKMKGHYIICGCGRIGYLICRELFQEKMPFVVIDNNPEVLQKLEDDGFVYQKGDATQDRTLMAAGIKQAKGIVCVLPTDAENLYVILTAKDLNPDIYILSRSEEEESEHRLLRAGANKVMSPYHLGGIRMAMAILRPAMLDFIEITTRRQSLELRMEELAVCDGSPVIGQSLEQSEIRVRYGLIIVAVKKESGKMIFNPLATYVIENGDKLVALGEGENVRRFAEVCLV